MLVASDGEEVAERLRSLTPEHARQIGKAAQQRILSEHTAAHRAEELEGHALCLLSRKAA